MNNRIEKQIDLAAPVSRVWQALTDHREFGKWFGVHLDGPFVAGEASGGHMTISGYEHIRWNAFVKSIEPQSLFSYTWHPYGIDPDVDYTKEEPTLVEFRLEPSAKGTLLTVTESGFERVPAQRRDEAFRMNDRGWAAQIQNIEKHVT